MTIGSTTTAILFAVLALAHSAAGETGLIQPLLRADWTIEEIPRWAADRLLRTAWHLTSVAWLAMAAVSIGGGPLAAVSVAALASAAMMFIGLRGHFAWPLFLLAGLFGLHGVGWLTTPLLAATTALGVAAALGLAALHVYWAFGGGSLKGSAIPATPDGTPTFSPGPLATMAVALLLAGLAALAATVAATDEWAPLRWLLLAGVGLLTLRAVGDGRHVGFSKQNRATRFAVYDDRFFTPIVVFLAIASAAAVLV